MLYRNDELLWDFYRYITEWTVVFRFSGMNLHCENVLMVYIGCSEPIRSGFYNVRIQHTVLIKLWNLKNKTYQLHVVTVVN